MTTLQEILWPDQRTVVFAVIDGASVEDLLDKLYDEYTDLAFECLYSGEIEPDIAEVAPYLVKIEPNSPFSRWFSSGWGHHWGIYLQVAHDVELAQLRRHLRKLNIVYNTKHESLYFRYYDPRVLGDILPKSDAQQQKEMFGCITQFVIETEAPNQALRLSLANGKLVQDFVEFVR